MVVNMGSLEGISYVPGTNKIIIYNKQADSVTREQYIYDEGVIFIQSGGNNSTAHSNVIRTLGGGKKRDFSTTVPVIFSDYCNVTY